MCRLLLALCRCRLGLCSTHCLHPSTYSMTTYQFFTTAPGAVQSRAHPSKTTCRHMSRLSLRKGEGEGEGPSWFNCMYSFQTPHLHPLPLLKGRGDGDHSTDATFR